MSRSCTCFLVLLVFTCLSQYSFSQNQCGFDELHKAALKDPVYKRKFDSTQKQLKDYIQRQSLSAASPLATVYRIPVVVHVIHKGEAVGTGTNISDAQINSAITSLNQFFRNGFGTSVDVEVEFELANINPSCQTTTAINRIDGTVVADYATNGITIPPFGTTNQTAVKALSTWSNSNYYNIWIVSEINNNNAGAGIQGFATFPTPSPVDGTVVLYNAFGYDPGGVLGYNLKAATRLNKTLVHEMGHAFNLFHSFEGDDANNDGVADQCPANTTCATQGDRVCDTDPHQRSPSNCPTGSTTCAGASNDPIVRNFMDYSSDVCQDRFTTGQVTRMRASLETDRASLLTSLALESSYPITPYSQPIAASCTPATDPTGGLIDDFAGMLQIGINGRDFSSSVPRIDNGTTGFVNWTPDCHTLNQLVRGGTYTFSVILNGANDQQLRAWIDYDNNGVFNNATEEIYVSTHISNNYPNNVTVSGNFTIPATATINTGLRLRVVDDVSTGYGFPAISTGCFNPTYGQAEDFQVFITSGLPITLAAFTAKKDDQDILLTWQTSSEQNSKQFEVEKSHDGINFIKIGTVSAAGNSSSPRNYFYSDRTITQENNYYRLKQVDLDDQFEYSKIVLIKNLIINKAPFTLLTNPIQNNIDLQFGDISDTKVQVRLTDITGKLLMTWNGENVANRRIRINISDKNLSNGVYILNASVDGKQYIQKVVIK
jgi:hypothetical protein